MSELQPKLNFKWRSGKKIWTNTFNSKHISFYLIPVSLSPSPSTSLSPLTPPRQHALLYFEYNSYSEDEDENEDDETKEEEEANEDEEETNEDEDENEDEETKEEEESNNDLFT